MKADLREDYLLVLRCGINLIRDSAKYKKLFEDLLRRSPEFEGPERGLEAVLEIWAKIQSIPEPNNAILTMWKRDCPYNMAFLYLTNSSGHNHSNRGNY